MKMAAGNDPFEGIWELDPDTLDYQFGRPGRRARYRMEPLPDGQMRFTLDGEDADGNPLHFVYAGDLNNSRQPLHGDLVLILNRVGPDRIDSLLEREGTVVDHWARELLPGGEAIRFTQFAPNGLRNVSVYRRVTEVAGR